MHTVTVREARLNFSRVVHQGFPSLVLRRGKPIAAIVPFKSDLDAEDFLLANSPHIRKRIRAAEKDIAAGRVISLEDYLAGKRI